MEGLLPGRLFKVFGRLRYLHTGMVEKHFQHRSGGIPFHQLTGHAAARVRQVILKGPVAKTKNTKLQKNRLGSPKRVAQSAFLR